MNYLIVTRDDKGHPRLDNFGPLLDGAIAGTFSTYWVCQQLRNVWVIETDWSAADVSEWVRKVVKQAGEAHRCWFLVSGIEAGSVAGNLPNSAWKWWNPSRPAPSDAEGANVLPLNRGKKGVKT